MDSKVLVIVGMHRSGTSVITHWLSRCGLSIGEKLSSADLGNIEGHFEDSDFLNLHEELLTKRNLPHTGFVKQFFGRLQITEKEKIKSLVESKSRDNNQWGWKEPRTCLFLETYNEVMPSAHYLIITRDYNLAVNSLLSREYKYHLLRFNTKRGLSRLKWILFKRKNLPQFYRKHAENFLKVWIIYYEQIIQHIQSLPKEKSMQVDFSQLLKNDRKVFENLQQWQFSLEYVPFSDVFKRELLSKEHNIDLYISDKNLIAKARELQQQVRDFFCKNN